MVLCLSYHAVGPISRLILFLTHLDFLIRRNHNWHKLIVQNQTRKSMTYRYLEHMTDAFIEVTGETLQEAFESAGIAVVDTILDFKSVEEKTERKIEIIADELNSLLYSWLEEIIVLTITEGFAARRFTIQITKNSKYFLKARIYGEGIDFEKHHFKLEIKAPTYHLMEIKEEKPVVMRFLLDL